MNSIPGWEEEDEVGGGGDHIEGEMIGLENDIGALEFVNMTPFSRMVRGE